ncbi:FtsQ-type POTRA domain-containing protein [Candidatus Peribacteria bacterium]|nr:FtsQ-type POTRA domain-containing protein [Candidatus Peribacteria bacterium]
MPSVLKRLTRPLPRQFNRPVTQGTRMFVERRHKRDRQHSRERSRRWVRRWRTFLVERLAASRRWFKYLLALAAVLVVCLFLFSPLLQIREVRVVRTEGRVDLQKVLETLSPLYGQHLLFLSTRDVTARVRQVVPDAVSVSVTKQYPSQVSVRIMLAPLVAHVRIAADETLLASGSGSVVSSGASGSVVIKADSEYLTGNGLLVSADRPPTAEPLPTIRVVDWSVRPVPGTVILPPEFFDRLRRAENALTLEFGQQVGLRTVYLRAREFHLDTPAISFWFDIRTPLEAQLQRLRTFLKAVKLPEVKEYIDLRLTGRVVYQ